MGEKVSIPVNLDLKKKKRKLFTPNDRLAVHVFRCILEKSVSSIMILYGVERYGLETSPTHR